MSNSRVKTFSVLTILIVVSTTYNSNQLVNAKPTSDGKKSINDDSATDNVKTRNQKPVEDSGVREIVINAEDDIKELKKSGGFFSRLRGMLFPAKDVKIQLRQLSEDQLKEDSKLDAKYPKFGRARKFVKLEVQVQKKMRLLTYLEFFVLKQQATHKKFDSNIPIYEAHSRLAELVLRTRWRFAKKRTQDEARREYIRVLEENYPDWDREDHPVLKLAKERNISADVLFQG